MSPGYRPCRFFLLPRSIVLVVFCSPPPLCFEGFRPVRALLGSILLMRRAILEVVGMSLAFLEKFRHHSCLSKSLSLPRSSNSANMHPSTRGCRATRQLGTCAVSRIFHQLSYGHGQSGDSHHSVNTASTILQVTRISSNCLLSPRSVTLETTLNRHVSLGSWLKSLQVMRIK